MKRQISVILCLVLSIILTGCKVGKGTEDAGTYIYYVNTDGMTLEKEEYVISEKNIVKEAETMLKELKKTPDAVEIKSAIPKEVKIKKVQLKGSQLEVYFNEEYLKMKKGTEVLCRAAVVQTLVQIEGVNFVLFYVGNEPLEDKNGNVVGLMRAEDFVQNTGTSLNSYQITTLNLYFANKDGTELESEKISNVHYNSNTSIEKLVVEQLMKGPTSGKMNPTIPKVTKLLGVSVRDGICYVNFDSSFLTEGYNQKAEIPIYSVVNSILENGSAKKVQILIDGADVTFKQNVKLNGPLEWNAELIKEKKE